VGKPIILSVSKDDRQDKQQAVYGSIGPAYGVVSFSFQFKATLKRKRIEAFAK
jgi:hypothetical protein